MLKLSEPNLIPKLRFGFADFPWPHYSCLPEVSNLGTLLRISVRSAVDAYRLHFCLPSRADAFLSTLFREPLEGTEPSFELNLRKAFSGLVGTSLG